MAKQLKIGELVKCLDIEDELLDRRIVNICGNLVFVCTDQEFASAKKEGRAPLTVGWSIDACGL
jgi:hypothetical protein